MFLCDVFCRQYNQHNYLRHAVLQLVRNLLENKQREPLRKNATCPATFGPAALISVACISHLPFFQAKERNEAWPKVTNLVLPEIKTQITLQKYLMLS